MQAAMRVRLKADGRIVQILSDGSERPLERSDTSGAPSHPVGQPRDAAYARGIRARTHLTQAQFASRIEGPDRGQIPNWEQGKRSPRGPARALLSVLYRAPDLAVAALKPEFAAAGLDLAGAQLDRRQARHVVAGARTAV